MKFEERSNDIQLTKKNLQLILSSNSYELAHEDLESLNNDEMRGVRMLLWISKPEQMLEIDFLIHFASQQLIHLIRCQPSK